MTFELLPFNDNKSPDSIEDLIARLLDRGYTLDNIDLALARMRRKMRGTRP